MLRLISNWYDRNTLMIKFIYADQIFQDFGLGNGYEGNLAKNALPIN